MQTCSRCGQTFPATTDYFHRLGVADRLRPDCKACRSAHQAKRYRENPDAFLERNRRWKAENPDKISAQSLRWAREHPERRRETDRRYRQRNRARVTQRHRDYVARNRERVAKLDRDHHTRTIQHHRQLAQRYRDEDPVRYRAYQENRRALKLARGSFTKDDIARQYAAQGGRCRWCSESLDGLYHIDHVVPLSRGGSNTPENLVCSCPNCNHTKSARLPFVEWTPPNPLSL